MVELADTAVLETVACNGHLGSSPSGGTMMKITFNEGNIIFTAAPISFSDYGINFLPYGKNEYEYAEHQEINSIECVN